MDFDRRPLSAFTAHIVASCCCWGAPPCGSYEVCSRMHATNPSTRAIPPLDLVCAASVLDNFSRMINRPRG